jgi:integrase
MTGSIVTRTLKDGTKRYDAVYRAGGKQRWKTFKRRKDAEKFLTSVVKEVHDGTYVHVQPLLMDAVFDRWLSHSLEVRKKTALLKPSTAKSYKSMLATHLRPAFKDVRSDRFTAETVGEWVRERADDIADGTLAPKTYNNLLNLLHVIMAWARERGQRYLAHDPLADVRRLPRVRTEMNFLEPAEINALLEAARASVAAALAKMEEGDALPSPDDTILYVAVYTGLRRGEIFGLQWSDVDEADAQFRIRRSIYQGDITRPKTLSSERMVDVPARLVEMLKTYRKSYPALEGDFVFRTSTGTPLDPDNWYKRAFLPLLKKAELRPVGLHALRHTYASLLINGGESIKYVSKQLGHASIQITADTYGHLFKETSVSAMNRLTMRMPAAKALRTGTGD